MIILGICSVQSAQLHVVASRELRTKVETKVRHGSGNPEVRATGRSEGVRLYLPLGRVLQSWHLGRLFCRRREEKSPQEETEWAKGCSRCSGKEHSYELLYHWEQEERDWAWAKTAWRERQSY